MARVICLSNGKGVLVDDEDYGYLKDISWHQTNSQGYARTQIRRGKGRRESFHMHHMVLQVPRGTKVDHRNGNNLDNRKCNLRPATQQQNSYNQRLVKGTKTGLKGVTKIDGKYMTRIAVQGTRLYLGCFEDPRVAAVEYNRAALKYHGEFANLNKPVGGHFNVR